MSASALLVALTFVLQVPPPTSSGRVAEPLRREQRAILDREADKLRALAERLGKAGQAAEADVVRKSLPPPPPPDGASRFVPVPEVGPERGEGLANVPVGG